MNKTNHLLVVIGYLGTKRCYLNVPLEEAKERYRKSEEMEPENKLINEFDFEDEFSAYEAYEN